MSRRFVATGAAAIVTLVLATLAVVTLGSHRSTPTLGNASDLQLGPYSVGFGVVRPTQISFGGASTSNFAYVHWSSWGGPRAVARGFEQGGQGGSRTASHGSWLPVEIRASNLGRCGTTFEYRSVTIWGVGTNRSLGSFTTPVCNYPMEDVE